MSQPSVAAWVKKLHDWDNRLAAIDARALLPAEAIDLATVRQQIRSSLVFWTVTRPWRRRPRVYLEEAINSVYLIVKRDFAPLGDRLASVVAREEQIPALLATARKNLDDVPRISVELALEELPGNIDFLRTTSARHSTASGRRPSRGWSPRPTRRRARWPSSAIG